MVTDTRHAMLDQPHMAELKCYVLGLRKLGHDVPDFDPHDGGVSARVAFLLESPGPRAVGSRFISRDNPDPSARNMKRLLADAGFDRKDVILWNVVPYSVSTIEKNKNASPAQVREATPHTMQFLRLLTLLDVIVLCGRRAQSAERHFSALDHVLTLKTYHPGAMAYNRKNLREHMHATFREAAKLIGR